jgi:hypothetical protein
VRVHETGQHDESRPVDDSFAPVARQSDADLFDDAPVHEHISAGELGSRIVERGNQVAAA